MGGLVEGFVKVVLVLMFAPLLLCLVFQTLFSVAAALVPWLLLFSAIAGITAGLAAGLVLRRRLPNRSGGGFPSGMPPLGAYRVRRPRGGWGER